MGIESAGRHTGQIVPAQNTQAPAKTAKPPQQQQTTSPVQTPQPASDTEATKKGVNKKSFEPAGVTFNKGPQPAKGGSLNNISVFTNGNAASAASINKILDHYNSPFKGKGQVIVDMCKKNNINPVMMMAIMQQESTFGKASPENAANPFSVHFNEGAKGKMKLRHPDGTKATFEESLQGAINSMKKNAGNSATPFTTAGNAYCEPPGPWLTAVKGHFDHLQKLL